MKTRQIKINWNKFDDIQFDENNHSYILKGQRLISCTQFINKFKTNIFDENFKQNYANKHGLDVDYVTKLWDIKKKLGSTKGSEIHLLAESWIKQNIKNEVSVLSKQEYNYLFNFFKDYNYLEFIKSEYICYSLKYKIAGTIDCIAKNKHNNEYYIIDFKTNKSLSTYNTICFKYPLNTLFQTDINIYTLQLFLYKTFLEESLHLNVSKLLLVHLNNSNKNYNVIDLNFKNIEDKFLLLLKNREKELL